MNNDSNTLGSNPHDSGDNAHNIINTLNNMYNININQIEHLNTSINGLIESNNQIRNMIVRLIDRQANVGRNTRSSSQASSQASRQPRRQHNNPPNENIRMRYNYGPYIFENAQENRILQNDLIGYFFPNITNTRTNIDNTNNPPVDRARTRENNITRVLQNFLQPIEVYPTQSQIDIATRRARYGDISSPINRDCPITLETFEDDDIVTMIRHCGHIFQHEGLTRWFRSNCRCPVCRYDIRSYETNVINNELDNRTIERNLQNENSLPAHSIGGTEAVTDEIILETITTELSSADTVLRDFLNDLSGNNLLSEFSGTAQLLNLFQTWPRRRGNT